MSVNAIGATQAVAQQQSSSSQSNWQNVLNSVSGSLGLSTSAVQQQLQSGQSLSSIAAAQGVSQQSLVQSISTALTQNGSGASGSQLQQIATNIANRTPSSGGHHHHHHGGASSSSSSSSASSSTAQTSLISSLLAAVLGQSTSSNANSSSSSGSTSTASTPSSDATQSVVQGLNLLA